MQEAIQNSRNARDIADRFVAVSLDRNTEPTLRFRQI